MKKESVLKCCKLLELGGVLSGDVVFAKIVFSLKPDVRRKRRSHGVRRNGLSRRKQRLNRSMDDLLRIAKNNDRHELLNALSSIPVSRLKPILDEADRRSLRHSDWFKLKMIMAFSFNKLFPRKPSLPSLNKVYQN